jgi:hypothetical protein
MKRMQSAATAISAEALEYQQMERALQQRNREMQTKELRLDRRTQPKPLKSVCNGFSR